MVRKRSAVRFRKGARKPMYLAVENPRDMQELAVAKGRRFFAGVAQPGRANGS
jgi:hypothetical protein